jgi:hypothetical protein
MEATSFPDFQNVCCSRKYFSFSIFSETEISKGPKCVDFLSANSREPSPFSLSRSLHLALFLHLGKRIKKDEKQPVFVEDGEIPAPGAKTSAPPIQLSSAQALKRSQNASKSR